MKTYKLKWQVLLFGLLLSINPIYSQSKFEMSAGLGMPELINAGIKEILVFLSDFKLMKFIFPFMLKQLGY